MEIWEYCKTIQENQEYNTKAAGSLKRSIENY